MLHPWKWLLRLLGEPWLAVTRLLTVRGLQLRLRPHSLRRKASRPPAYESQADSVLYVAASCLPFHTSGYTTRTHELCRALGESGAAVHVLTRPGYPWDRADRARDPEGTETRVEDMVYAHTPAPSKFRPVLLYALQAAPVIAGIARSRRAAVIHAASNHVNALPALLAARQLGIPFSYEMRGLWELTRVSRMPDYEGTQSYRQGLELEGLVARHADRVFVISDHLRRYAAKEWGIPAERMFLLPNCVDPDRLLPAEATTSATPEETTAPATPETPAEAATSATPTSPPPPATPATPATPPPSATPATSSSVSPDIETDAIVYAGSLIAYEGLDLLIDAVALLAAQGRPVLARIAGEGEARGQLEAQAQRLGLARHIRFLGRISPTAARDLVRRAALVCIPRRPFAVCELVPPIKLVEALALGKAVVVPDLPLFRDELGDAGNGFFFTPGDARSLAETIARLLDDKALRDSAGQRARAYAATRRNWRNVVPDIAAAEQRGPRP